MTHVLTEEDIQDGDLESLLSKTSLITINGELKQADIVASDIAIKATRTRDRKMCLAALSFKLKTASVYEEIGQIGYAAWAYDKAAKCADFLDRTRLAAELKERACMLFIASRDDSILTHLVFSALRSAKNYALSKSAWGYDRMITIAEEHLDRFYHPRNNVSEDVIDRVSALYDEVKELARRNL